MAILWYIVDAAVKKLTKITIRTIFNAYNAKTECDTVINRVFTGCLFPWTVFKAILFIEHWNWYVFQSSLMHLCICRYVALIFSTIIANVSASKIQYKQSGSFFFYFPKWSESNEVLQILLVFLKISGSNQFVRNRVIIFIEYKCPYAVSKTLHIVFIRSRLKHTFDVYVNLQLLIVFIATENKAFEYNSMETVQIYRIINIEILRMSYLAMVKINQFDRIAWKIENYSKNFSTNSNKSNWK